jgi:hypothetical protein
MCRSVTRPLPQRLPISPPLPTLGWPPVLPLGLQALALTLSAPFAAPQPPPRWLPLWASLPTRPRLLPPLLPRPARQPSLP